MSEVTVSSSVNTNVELSIGGYVLPFGVGIFCAVIREDCLYAVPTLDFIISDANGVIGTSIKILDGTILKCAIYRGDSAVDALTFKVASIKPSKIGTMTYYNVSAYFQSDLIMPKNVWNFTGNAAAAFANIIASDGSATPVKFLTNFTTTEQLNTSNFKKLATESFAKYIRRMLLPSMPVNNVSYWLYYHNGYNCLLINLITLLQNFKYKDGDFAFTPSNFMQWSINSESFHKNVSNSSYGGEVWQYDAEAGAYSVVAQAKGFANYNVNKDTTVSNKQVNMVASSTGNHPIDYLPSISQNMKNKGVFNVEMLVQVNYQTNLQGLQVVPIFYDKAKYIPFIVAGKSIIMRNGMYEEQLKLISNEIDQSILSAMGTSLQN